MRKITGLLLAAIRFLGSEWARLFVRLALVVIVCSLYFIDPIRSLCFIALYFFLKNILGTHALHWGLFASKRRSYGPKDPSNE